MKYTPAQLAKSIVSAIATVITIVTAALSIPGIIPLPWLPYIAGGVSILGTVAVVIKRNEPILEGGKVSVGSLAADMADVRTLIDSIVRQLNPPSPSPRSARTVSAGTVTVDVVPRVDTAAFQAAAAAAQEAPVPDPAPVPQAEPSAPTGTYPDGPYLPPKPAYTGPIPPVSEPVGATAVSAAP